MPEKIEKAGKILILDFDHTCYDTDSFLLEELREPMLRRFGIPPEHWEEAYEKAAEAGYTLEVHLEELTKIMGSAPCSAEEIRDFAASITFDKYLFPDTLPVLEKAKESGYKIMILSFGNPEWQDKKVEGSGLKRMADEVLYVKMNGNGAKAEKIKESASNFEKIIFVDNSGKHLDEILKIMPEVETYFINRVAEEGMNAAKSEYLRIRYMESRKIAEREALPVHKRIKTLEEITL